MGFSSRCAYLRHAPRSRKVRTDMIAPESNNAPSIVSQAALASVFGMGAFVIWSSLAGLAGCFA